VEPTDPLCDAATAHTNLAFAQLVRSSHLRQILVKLATFDALARALYSGETHILDYAGNLE
jgi:hypothetical protein